MFNVNVDLAEITCCECHISFWVTAAHNIQLRETHEYFYCPRGHLLHFKGETEAERLRRLYDKEKNQRTYCQNRLVEQQECSEKLARSINGYKGALAKMKKKHERPTTDVETEG